MIGRTPATIRATRPLRHGVVADLEMAEQMLRYFVRMACGGRPMSARAIVCVPTGITEVERRAVEEATLAAGAKRAHLIEEPLAGAIGAGLPVAEASGSFVLDIGGGTSEMAVVALGGMVVSHSVRIGGYELDDAIVRHVQNTHKLLIGPQQAERVKLEVGSAIELEGEDELTTEVTGRDLLSGLLRRIELPAAEVRTAIAAPVGRIVEAVHDTLERTPARARGRRRRPRPRPRRRRCAAARARPAAREPDRPAGRGRRGDADVRRPRRGREPRGDRDARPPAGAAAPLRRPQLHRDTAVPAVSRGLSPGRGRNRP